MTRLRDWPARLSAYIEASRHVPFQWGVHDCCTFADDAVIAMTGTSKMGDLRRYTTARGAAGLIKRAGGLQALASSVLGEPTHRARRGDVVMFESVGHGPALGICIGPHFAARGFDGVTFGDMSAAQCAWRID